MNTKLLAILASSLSLATLAGCNKAEAPANNAADVAEARQEANQDLDEARKEASEEMGSAAADMRESSQDVEEARIEGEHKVAMEQCEALPGEAQKSCKDTAEATYESAKERLKTQMSNNGGTTGSAAAPGTSAAPATGTATATTPASSR
jgi:hypothetical protein